METEQNSQTFSLSKQSKRLEQLPLGDQDEGKAPSQRGLNLRPLLRIVQRKAILITGITSLVTAGAWYSSTSSPAVFMGNFRLLVEPVTTEAKLSEPSALTRSEQEKPSRESLELDYPTQLEILQSPKLLSAIVKQIQAEYPNFSEDKLRKGLIVQRTGATDQSSSPESGNKPSGALNPLDATKIIEVSYQGTDPKQVQLVIEATARRYLKYSLEERKSRISEGVNFIEDQLPTLRKRVDTLATQLQRLQEQYDLLDPIVQRDKLLEQINQITDQQLEAQRLLQEQRTLYSTLEKQLNLTPDEALAASTLSQSPSYQKLLVRLKEVESQIALESARFQWESPNMQALLNQQQNLISLLDQEKQQVLGQNLASQTSDSQVFKFQDSTRLALIQQLVSANNGIQVLEVRSQALAQAKTFFTRQIQQFPEIARQYSERQRQLDIATKTLDQLLTQRETLRVEAAQSQVPWELISDPQLPRDAAGNPEPISSGSGKKLPLGVFGGLLLGVGAAVIVEKYRNIFYSIEDIKDVSQMPLLGIIPSQTNSPSLSNSTSFIGAFEDIESGNFNDFQFLKAFDSLYANIRFLISEPPVRSLAVCSAEPGDGKSTIALYLAQTAAATGKKVLLVDADLRLPKIYKWLNLSNLEGLSELLSSQRSINDFIVRSPWLDNLFVLPAGQSLPNSTKLLASTQMQEFMKKFRTNFDLVIYDTPHLLSYTDAVFLAAHTDGILMIVAVDKTKQSSVKQAIEQLNTYGLPKLGVVANHVSYSSPAISLQANVQKEIDISRNK